MGKRLCNCDFSFLLIRLVSNVKNQSKLAKSLLVGGQCLDRVMFCISHCRVYFCFAKEHVQLRFAVQKSPVFRELWSKLEQPLQFCR